MEPIVAIVLVFAFLFLIYYLAGKLAPGMPQRIIGIVLVVVFVLYALNRLGLLGSVRI